MRRPILIAALAVFVALALAATLTSRGHSKPATHAGAIHIAPSHSRAFWVHHNQP